MKYQATAKYLRISPRKAKLIADSLSGMSPVTALAQLKLMAKHGAKLFDDVIASAIANAKQKGANEQLLKIASIEVTAGPGMKRWQAVSRGMAHSYKKKMSHIKVTLVSGEEK